VKVHSRVAELPRSYSWCAAIKTRKWLWPRYFPAPMEAGEVGEVGEGVDTVTVGQRGSRPGIFMQHWLEEAQPTAESSRGRSWPVTWTAC